ncbi:copine-5-like [Anneissia japonica]|uniref:copine-5-like n=1 Tax=Anneissia japonica TaxID=1529436 RepID=UPI0014256CEC|nr:copine-5-like [Anneissia japonica]
MSNFGGFQPGSATANPSTKVEITVSCRNLIDKDVLSKSDPICVLYTAQLGTDKFAEFERTEIIQNNLNPDFVKKFILDYYFEECQRLKFEIYDIDSASSKLNRHDFLGAAQCSLGQILGSAGNRLQLPLQISSFTIAHKTEYIKNTLDPTWREFCIPVASLCNGDYDRTIKVECYDWDSDGSDDFIGEFRTNMRHLREGTPHENTYELINPKKKAKKKGYKSSGTISLIKCTVEAGVSFLDYITGGTQVNFTVAIDFTASNGAPSQANSLHYISGNRINAYEQAIMAVGQILQDYDSDKLFPVLGFGARIPPDGRVSHEFAVNFNEQNPFCAGIQGVMQAYKSCLPYIQLHGPTNFSPVINHVARFAQAYPDGSNYFILLIITDGIISDMDFTKDAIIKASSLPLSIIIIGVGPAEFDAMEVLDGDKQILSYRGKNAERDIVQFVPLRDFVGGVGSSSSAMLSQARLAKEVLAEVPDQFLSWMKKHGIKPNPSPPQQPNQQSHPAPTQQHKPQGYPVPMQSPSQHGYPAQQSSQYGYQASMQQPSQQGYPGASTVHAGGSYPGQAPPQYQQPTAAYHTQDRFASQTAAQPTAPSAPPAF